MALQARTDNDNTPIVLSDDAEVRTGIIIEAAQGDLVAGAILGEVTATPGVYALVADIVATDGTKIPKLILAEDVANDAAQQTGKTGYENGKFDENKLTLGGALTLDSRVVVGTNIDYTIRDLLRQMGLRTRPAVDVTGYENI